MTGQEKVDLLKQVTKLSMTGQEKVDLLKQVTA